MRVIHNASGISVGEGWNSTIGVGISPPYDLGNTDIRTSPSSAVNRQAIPVTTIAAGSIPGIKAYFLLSGGNVLVGLYADSGGSPGARLAVSNITPTPTAGVFTEIPFITPFAASASTTYWLAYVSDGTPNFVRDVAPITFRFHAIPGFTLPDPFGVSAPSVNGPSVFATVTP
jgi:hypothetical protein